MARGNQHIYQYFIFKYPCCCQCWDITTRLAGVNPTTVTVCYLKGQSTNFTQ